MGHLCLTGATDVARPFLTHLLITPSGHGKSQSLVGCWDHCCPTGDLLSGWQSDMWLLLSSCRRDRKISLISQEALLQLRDTLQTSKNSKNWGLLGGQQSVCDFLSAAGLSKGLMQIRSFKLCFQKLIAHVISINSNPNAPDWEEEVPAQLLQPLLWWQHEIPAAWLILVLANCLVESNSWQSVPHADLWNCCNCQALVKMSVCIRGLQCDWDPRGPAGLNASSWEWVF